VSDPLAPYRGVRVLVTGATGFIGAWTARRLAEAGADLHVAVRGPAPLPGTPHLVDLADPAAGPALVRRLAPAVVFNLAGYGVDPDERRDADRALAECLNAALPPALALALADRPARWPGLRLVHAGSVLEYGPIAGPLIETAAPAPAGLYGQTKLAGTQALAEAARARGLPAVTARLAQVYGPGEHAGRLLPQLLEARRTGRLGPLSVGTQRKDFTWVGDVADGLLRLGLAPAAPGEPVNLATGRVMTVRAFVLEAARVLPLPPGLLRFERAVPPGESDHDAVPIGRLRALTGWQPPTPVDEGIRLTAAHEGSR
jgi:UDP-glucose 4-epimerase